MRVLTWNINSVRLRIGLLLRLLSEQEPDIVCLQETKCPDEHFPADDLRSAGYAHLHFHGMKSYNGVAIISRHPFENPKNYDRVDKPDCRHISARFRDFELHNLYIPAGGDEPDPKINDKFAHKLDFVDEMAKWFKDQYTADIPLIAAGDFNIAPYEHDVWSHKQLLNVVSHTPVEVEKLGKMKKSLDWTDSSRHFVPENEKCYTWWSYRNRDWEKSNRGRRLDHIWVTPPLKDRLANHTIVREARNWEKCSDHVPLMIDLKK